MDDASRSRARTWWRSVGFGNLVLFALLGAAGVWLMTLPDVNAGPLGVVMMLAAVSSLLFVRTRPGLAAAVLVLAVFATQVFLGPLVTCGVVLPILAAIAFQVGSRPAHPGHTALAAVGVTGAAAIELWFDPALVGDIGALLVVVFLVGGLLAAGLVVRSRRRLLAALQQRTDELARQRDRTADLAVEADRARVGQDLELVISSRIELIAAAADRGRRAIDRDARHDLRAALVEVETVGRDTLARMRAVVGELHPAPTAPPPGLADLRDLLAETGSQTRLRIDEELRGVGLHLELAIYRIVEQLVTPFRQGSSDEVDVTLQSGPDAVHLQVTGSRRALAGEDRQARLALATGAAEARAEVLGGRVVVETAVDRHTVDVILPLAVPGAS